MSANTSIEWCDATVNHWVGCTEVSPACEHCYAKRMAARLWDVHWGPGQPRMQFKSAAEALAAVDRKAQRLGRPLRVFHNSVSDMFDNEVPTEWRRDAFHAMAATHNLIHLVLTKRIGNAFQMMVAADGFIETSPGAYTARPNIWLGATIANQEEADRDIPKLLAVPARVRFLSMEPLLGPVDVRWAFPDIRTGSCHRCGFRTNAFGGRCPNDGETLRGDVGVDWVIVGGESGPHARPMHPDWARSLRDQCEAAGVPFLFKQWGEWLPVSQDTDNRIDSLYRSNKIAAPHEDQGRIDDLYGRTCKVPALCIQSDGTTLDPLSPMAFRQGSDPMLTFRAGKKAAGRLLDGRTWDQFPEATP